MHLIHFPSYFERLENENSFFHKITLLDVVYFYKMKNEINNIFDLQCQEINEFYYDYLLLTKKMKKYIIIKIILL